MSRGQLGALFGGALLTTAFIGGCGAARTPTASQAAVTYTPAPTSTTLASPDAATPAAAMQVTRQYENALISGDYAAAWSLLSAFSQDAIGREAFDASMKSLIETTGTTYIVETPDQTWSNLIPSFSDGEREDIIRHADRPNAYGVVVQFPKSESADLGRQDFVVAKTSDGSWKIWIVH